MVLGPRAAPVGAAREAEIVRGFGRRHAEEREEHDGAEEEREEREDRGDGAARSGLGEEEHSQHKDRRGADAEKYLGGIDPSLPGIVAEPERAGDHAVSMR